MKDTLHHISVLLTICVALALPQSLFADDQATIDHLRERLANIIPGTPDVIVKTPIDGFYEARYGANIIYMSADGRYAMQGNLVDLETRDNLTETSRTVARADLIRQIDEATMLVYAPDGDVKHTITVFTDVDCPYCQRMHDEIAQLLDEGIKVRYILFPRSEAGSPSYMKSESIWCAEDRKQAFDTAKGGKQIQAESCDNPIAEHRAIGESLGISGTPAIVLESGDMIPGYRPATELAVILDQLAAMRAHSANN